MPTTSNNENKDMRKLIFFTVKSCSHSEICITCLEESQTNLMRNFYEQTANACFQ